MRNLVLERHCAERGLMTVMTGNVHQTKVMLLAGKREAKVVSRAWRAGITYAGAAVQLRLLSVVFHCTQPLKESTSEGREQWPALKQPCLRVVAMSLGKR